MELKMLLSVVGAFGSIGAKIGECLMVPVGRHFCYLYSYKSKLENLEKEVERLDEKRDAVQKSVDEAKRNVKIIRPDVKGWQERVDKCSKEARGILEGEIEANKWCLSGWCPNLKLRYSLGKKATKKVEEVAKLCGDQDNFREVAYTERPPGIEFTPIQGIKGFKSRRLIMNDVMEALKDDRFHMIGICGMGGVGKTTMVKEVAKQAQEEKLFNEVVMAVVSQSPDDRKIQDEIADKLGLSFEEQSKSGRANRLHESLRCTEKNLVILDDVWKRLELNDIGIPFGDGHKGCKILLTSRSEDACNNMKAQKIFTVPVLTEEEAWNLFKEMAGISNDTSHTSTDLYITQKKVANECGCLPIAIVTVARALKDRDRHSWNSALQQLQKSIIKNIGEVEENVFKSLELSYDFLKSIEAKKCFLLCSLYPEDFDIPIEDLVRYGVGIELFESIDSVKEARDRVHAFVDDLKKAYLLIDSYKTESVKMHDVVRDVAISIASRKEHSFMVRCDKALKEWPEKERHKNYAVISLQCAGMSRLPDNLEFPELHLLQLLGNRALQKIPDCFYGGMKELKSLGLLHMSIEGSLPTSLRWLTNLRSLSLRNRQINDLSVIGALENLEILSFYGTMIKELPKEIGQLSNLKLLDLWYCRVERIYPGVLSRLSKLEELYLGASFRDQNSIEETKATITELGFLNNFTTLEIDLVGFAYWPRDLVLTNLEVFSVTIDRRGINSRDGYQLNNQLILYNLHNSDQMVSGFKNFFKIAKILILERVVGVKNVVYDLDIDGFKQLTELLLDKCQDLEYLIKTADGVPVSQRAFPVLQLLRLHNLDKLKEICHGQLPKEAFSALKELELLFLPTLTHLWKGPTQLVRLRNLISVEVRRCDKLESLFSLSIARDLMQLQTLEISECRMMEVIISSEEGYEHEIASATSETMDKIVFPKLKELSLQNLPSFTAIYKAIHAIELLPQLNRLQLDGIPNLKSLWNASESNYDTIQPLFNNKDVEYLFETAAASGIPQRTFCILQFLHLKCLDKLTEICHGQLPEEAFSALKELILDFLPALTHLWKGPTQLVRLRNLTFVEVQRCDKLESLFSFSIARDLMQLETLKISKCRIMEVLISSDERDQHATASSSATTTETIDKIVFPKLKKLCLQYLPSLTAICKDMNAVELPQWNSLFLIDVPKRNSFCNASESNYDIIQPLFHNKVKLLTIERLVICMCHRLSNILFPSNLIKGMQSLKQLAVIGCQSVEVAFDLEGIIVTEGYPDFLLPSLKNLILGYLPKLTHIWKDNLSGIPSFHNLKSLQISLCGSLRYIFSSSQAKLLVNLRKIKVAECVMIELLIDEEPKVGAEVTTNIIMFPQLNSLILRDLPNLRSLCPQASTFEESFLKIVEIINCPNMKALPSAFQRIQEQQGTNIQEADFFTSAQHHLLDGKFNLKSNGELTVTGINEPTEIWHNPLEAGCLHQVRVMQVQCCGKLLSVVSSHLIQKLHNIEELKIWGCDSLEMIFDLQEEVCADVGEEETSITQLSNLELKCLPKLKHIWNNISQQTHCFENLKSLNVEFCDNLRYIFTISMANVLVNLDYLTISLCEKVEKIVTRENEEEILSRQFGNIKLMDLPSLVCFGPDPDVNDTRIPARRIIVALCPKFADYGYGDGDSDGDGFDSDFEFDFYSNNEDEDDDDD